MKQLMLSVISAFVLMACSSSDIGNNPTVDGQEMMYQSLVALKNDDVDEANDIIGKYLQVYEQKELSEQTAFCNASSETYWNELISLDYPGEEWTAFFRKMRPVMEWYSTTDKSLSQCPNFVKLRDLQSRILGK